MVEKGVEGGQEVPFNYRKTSYQINTVPAKTSNLWKAQRNGQIIKPLEEN